MSIPSNKIAKLRKEKGLSQQQLAEKIGAHSVTISNLERGKAELTFEWAEKIGEALGVEWPLLIEDEPATRVYLRGWIMDQGDVHHSSDEENYPADLKLGFMRAIAASWYVVADDTMYPAFQTGDVLRMVTVDDEDAQELEGCFGRLCILQSPDHDSYSSLGYLRKSSIPGKASLDRINGRPWTDVTIESVHVIDRAFFRPVLPTDVTDLIKELSVSAK